MTLRPGDARDLATIESRIAELVLSADAANADGNQREAGRLVEEALTLHRLRARLVDAILFAEVAAMGAEGRYVRVRGLQ